MRLPIQLNPLQCDILSIIMQSSAKRLLRRNIKKGLYPKHEGTYEDENSFNVTLQRALKKLVASGHLKKDDRGHQQVHYYIPRRKQKLVAEHLKKQEGQKPFDTYWNALKPEERRQEVETLKQKNEQTKKNLHFLRWKDNETRILNAVERIGDVWQIGYLGANATYYFEAAQGTLDELEKSMERGEENRWSIDSKASSSREKLISILRKRAIYERAPKQSLRSS